MEHSIDVHCTATASQEAVQEVEHSIDVQRAAQESREAVQEVMRSIDVHCNITAADDRYRRRHNGLGDHLDQEEHLPLLGSPASTTGRSCSVSRKECRGDHADEHDDDVDEEVPPRSRNGKSGTAGDRDGGAATPTRKAAGSVGAHGSDEAGGDAVD
jgi:hypothetical protein